MFCPVTSPGQQGPGQTVTRVFYVERQISIEKIIFIKVLFFLVPPVDLWMKTAEFMFEDMKQFCS